MHNKFNGRNQELPYLSCCLRLTDLLLAYTDKEISDHLRRKNIAIEMYAPRLVTTLYTRVVEFSLLYELWEIFLFERDKYFIFYFAVGILIGFKPEILRLQTFEQLIVYLQSIKIESYALLADIYFHALQVRRHAPASFETLVASLGIFKYNPIISEGELDTIKSIHKVQIMPVYPRELLLGSDKVLEQLEPNNNKFENLLVINEDDKQVYLAPSSRTMTETGSFYEQQRDSSKHTSAAPSNGHASGAVSQQSSSQQQVSRAGNPMHGQPLQSLHGGARKQGAVSPTYNQSMLESESHKSSMLHRTTSSNEDSSFFRQSEFLDPLVRISQMKFLTTPDIRVANCAKFACLDIRQRKQPPLSEIFRDNNPALAQR